MDDLALIDLLKDLARRLGMEVVTVPLGTGDQELTVKSGACSLRGRRMVILARGAALSEKRDALLAALNGEDLEGIYIPPAVRRLLEDGGGSGDD